MISAIKRARKDSIQSEQSNSRDSLLYQPNSYVIQSLATVQRKPPKSRKLLNDAVRSMYPNTFLGDPCSHSLSGSPSPTNDPHTLYEEDTLEGSSMSEGSTVFSQPRRAVRRKTVAPKPKKKTAEKESKRSPKRDLLNPTALEAPLLVAGGIGYSNLAMLDLMADAYTKVWECYLRDHFIPLVDIVKDIFAHNRLSRNLVDPKMRSVFEFFVATVPATSYNVRRATTAASATSAHAAPTGEASAADSRPASRSSTPRRDGAQTPMTRPSTSGTGPLPKRALLQTQPPAADYPAANTHFFLFGRILGTLPCLFLILYHLTSVFSSVSVVVC
jgi:hypothetical protein